MFSATSFGVICYISHMKLIQAARWFNVPFGHCLEILNTFEPELHVFTLLWVLQIM